MLGADVLKPVLDGRNTTTVFEHVLLTNPSHRNHSARTILDRMPEYALALKDSLGMMPQCSVAEVRHEFFRRIKPIVNGLIVRGLSPPAFRAATGVVIWVCHD